jgi:hypothetical protein
MVRDSEESPAVSFESVVELLVKSTSLITSTRVGLIEESIVVFLVACLRINGGTVFRRINSSLAKLHLQGKDQKCLHKI